MVWILLLVVSLSGFGVHLVLTKTPRTRLRVVELLLLYLLVVNIGFGGIIAWSGHTFMADEIARKIGWQPGALSNLKWPLPI